LNILGISAFSGSSAACLVREGRVVAAAREELFTRRAQDASFPKNAIAYCLRAAKIGPSALGAVAWCGRPEEALAQRMAGALSASKGYSIFRRSLIDWPDGFFDARRFLARELDPNVTVHFVEETLSHAHAAFLSSPFSEAAVLAFGSGLEDPAVILGRGRGTEIEILDVGAAPLQERTTPIDDDEIVARARRAVELAGSKSIALAGSRIDWKTIGRRLLETRVAQEVWAHPAANGGACAAGAALLLSLRESIAPVRAQDVADRLDSAWSYGPGYNSHQIRTFLRSRDIHTEEMETEDLHAQVVALLSEKKKVGWFQGRLDLGAFPAASRSVLTAEPAEGEELFIHGGGRRGLDELARTLEARLGKPSLFASPLAKPGEPLACTPSDAYDCIDPLALDALAMGPYLVTREMAQGAGNSAQLSSASGREGRNALEECAAFFLWLGLAPLAMLGGVPSSRAANAWLAVRRFLRRTHEPGS
jgi:predicted NodU family carbamoyl transferase